MLERRNLSRILPFAAYMLFLVIQDFLDKFVGLSSQDLRWVYPVKVGVVLALLIYFWRDYDDLRQRLSMSALAVGVAVGVVVFVIWINANLSWMVVGSSKGFDPRGAQGSLDWFFVVVRLIGAALIVPVMEELFFRSFLMRWLVNPDISKVEPQQVSYAYLAAVSAVFAIEHTLWFAGLLAGLAYGLLYMRSKNLWTPIVAHGVTNGVLGGWVLHTGSWQYW